MKSNLPLWKVTTRMYFALLTIFWVGCSNEASFKQGGSLSLPTPTPLDAEPTQVPATPAPTPTPEATPTPTPAPTVPPKKYTSLTYFWQCSNDSNDIPKSDDSNLVVPAVPNQKIDPSMFDNPSITISGKICPLPPKPRDIVFVIDVSGSMDRTDKMTLGPDGGSCFRFQAVQQILKENTGSNNTYGIATFNGAKAFTSSKMFANAADLNADMSAGGTAPSDILCKAELGTNYKAGIDQAEVLLRLGRPDATKEIYFISDGDPDQDSNTGNNTGAAEADALKTKGISTSSGYIPVTIATILIADPPPNPDYTIPLSSKDSSGTLYHANIAKSDDLIKVLSSLSQNTVTSGEIKYHAIGSPNYISVPVKPYMSGQMFTLPRFRLNFADAPHGIEILFSIRDKFNHSSQSKGIVQWGVSQKD